MRLLKSSLLAGIIWGIAALGSLFAQAQLERISISERSDGNGYVVRYHLSEMIDSFEVAQPEANRIQMRLFSPEIDTSEFIPPEVNDEVTAVEWIRLENGIGVEITVAEGLYFLADAYPDQNLHDLLLSLDYSTRIEVEELAAETDAFIWRATVEQEEQEPEIQPEERAEESTTEPVPEEDDQPPVRRTPISAEFGLAGGAGISNTLGSEYSTQTREEFGMGLMAVIHLPYVLFNSIHTGIETGVFYIQKGFQNPAGVFDAQTVALDYIEIPVMGRFSYEFTDMITPYAIVGGYTAFISNAESIKPNGDRDDLDEVTKVVDSGLVIGAGSDLTIGKTTLTFQLRYSAALTETFEGGFSPGGEKNNHLFALMGIRF